MYLERIYVENVGPVERLDCHMPFHPDGRPKPVIFVGGNGCGKTVVLSTIADSMHEFAAQPFRDVLPEAGGAYSYFKITGGTNIRAGARFCASFLRYRHAGQSLQYVDKAGRISFAELSAKTNGELTIGNRWADDGNVKEVTAAEEILRAIFLNGAYCFFPAHRFESPHWLNVDTAVAPKTFISEPRFDNKLKKPISVSSSLRDTQQWLLDVALDFAVLQDRQPQLVVDWTHANAVLQLILQNKNASFGIGLRNAPDRLSIGIRDERGEWVAMLAPTLSHLSAGEAVLLNLFLTILRYSDFRPGRDLNAIEGIVLIDGIDLHLHADLQRQALPALLDLFPAVQFILTTHSPVFVSGMRAHFSDDGFSIIELPTGARLTGEGIKEFDAAVAAFGAMRAFGRALRENLAAAQKAIVLVEGDTDVRHIKNALTVLGRQDLLSTLDICDIGGLSPAGSRLAGKETLSHAINVLHANPSFATQRTMLLYDSDADKQPEVFGNVFVRCCKRNECNTLVRRGIENLYPAALFEDRVFYSTHESQGKMGERRRIETFDRKGFCDFICGRADRLTTQELVGFQQIVGFLEELTK